MIVIAKFTGKTADQKGELHQFMRLSDDKKDCAIFGKTDNCTAGELACLFSTDDPDYTHEVHETADKLHITFHADLFVIDVHLTNGVGTWTLDFNGSKSVSYCEFYHP